MIKIAMSSIISFLMFAIYTQFSPKIGNIWLRKDANLITRFAPQNLFKLIVFPLRSLQPWKPYLWDINYFMYVLILWIILFVIEKKFYNKIIKNIV